MNALDALGSAVRRDILVALRDRPLPVHELARRFSISRPAISRHVRVLQEAGLVDATAQGRESIYSVRLAGFASVREYLDGFWDVALKRLASLADEGHHG